MRKFFFIAVLAAAATLIGADSPAQGAFKLRISTDGGATFATTIQDNVGADTNLAPGFIGATFALPGGGSVDFRVSSNRLLGLPTGRLSQTELAFAGSAFNSGGAVFVIDVTDTDYTGPGGPLASLTSETSATGLSTPGGGGSQATVIFQSWVNDPNTEFGMGTFTGGPQGPFVNTNFGGPNAPDTVSISGPLAAPYSITSRFIVSNVNIPTGGSLQLTGTAQVTEVNAVPAPAGLVLALAGMPVFGLGAYIRRRAAKA